VTVMTTRRCGGLVAPGDPDGLQWRDRCQLPAGRAVVRSEDIDDLVVCGSHETVEMFAVDGWFRLEAEVAHCGDHGALRGGIVNDSADSTTVTRTYSTDYGCYQGPDQ
jgi:hypothetical protein